MRYIFQRVRGGKKKRWYNRVGQKNFEKEVQNHHHRGEWGRNGERNPIDKFKKIPKRGHGA